MRLLTTCQGPKRGKTGVVGVCLVNTAGRRYFSAHVRSEGGKVRSRRFNIDALGKEEAWRQALKARAEYEIRVRKANDCKVLLTIGSQQILLPNADHLEAIMHSLEQGAFVQDLRGRGRGIALAGAGVVVVRAERLERSTVIKQEGPKL